MAGILDHQGIFYQLGVLSTEQFRDSILGRNLPPPVNETLTQSGLVSKLEDIGKVIKVPIFGVLDENIPIHYNEDEKMFPLGTFYRTTQNVNLNPYSPQDDEYKTFNLTIPPNLPKSTPEEFGVKERTPYPLSYSIDRFTLINSGDKKGVPFPFNVIDQYKSLNFQTESSLGLLGGQELEKTIIDKIAQVEDEVNPNTNSTGYITQPVGDMVSNFVNRMRGNLQFFNTLPNNAVGWNEYNSSNIVPGGSPDSEVGVEPTMGVEIRMNTLLERTSVSQVQFTFDLLKRNSYRPLYEDRRLQGTDNEGTNGRYYIGTEKNTNRGDLVTKTFDSSDFNGESGGNGSSQRTSIEGISEPFGEPNKFFWTTGGEQNFNEKTLLYKTQQLVDNNQDKVYINQTKKFFKDKKQNRLISRGNAISESLLIDAESNGNYCRVWTVNDRYNYLRAIRNTGLFTSPNGTKGFSTTSEKSSLSVLMDNGIPKYHPVNEDSTTTRKKFMFSIENLAWADNLADLPLSEIGPGDTLSGNKGRIMWFPPYGITFDENSAASWTDTQFIGRSEPVYTYNNTTRSGSISFKIIVDHPRVINCYRGKSNNLIERFFSGCETPEDFLESLECSTSQLTQEEVKKKLKKKKAQKAAVLEKKSEDGNVNFICEADNVEEGDCEYVINQNELDDLISNIKTFVEIQSTETNPDVKITIKGFAGDGEGDLTETSKEIAKSRATSVRTEIESVVGSKNISYIEENQKVPSSTDSRRVEVKYENDAENSPSSQPKKEEQDNAAGTYDPEQVKIIDSLIIDESAYFDYIDGNYPNYFKTISEKIKYFQPGFHSTTPEGLNSRLTFLNQCMRQGPSIYDKGSDIRPQNLSFGRPPICILRIGDFFHTKIKINSLSISYDGPQFDLNPEGIGVQPMLASVQLSIDMIGGHSLSGPINRLQNAVSFNYYANTEIYEPRADYIKDGELIDGIKLSQIKKDAFGQAGLDQLIEDLKKEGTKDQKKDSETGNDSDGNGDNVLEIVEDNNTLSNIKVTIKTTDGKLPSEIVVGKKSNPDNGIEYEVKVGSTPKGNTVSENEVKVDINSVNSDALNPSILLQNNADLTQKEDELETAKTNFKNNKTQGNKNTFNTAKASVKSQKEKNEKYKKGKVDKVTVKAFLSKNKSKTKVTKTFTITEDGLI